MAKLLLTAENFAFGPIGKLLNMAPILKEQGHHLSFVGYGTAHQLAQSFPFDQVELLDTDSPASNEKLKQLISASDMVISSMDVPSVSMAHIMNKPVAWIDSLFWFWDIIPDPALAADMFVRERSLDDSVNEKKYKSKIKNLVTTGPILPAIHSPKRKHTALISFGGAEATNWYKAGKDTNYPYLMTNILFKYCDWSDFESVKVTSSKRVIQELAKKFPDSPFEFKHLPHDTFLHEMEQSELMLITPGLITSQEAFYTGTPTIFLPASNNSQYLQLEEFRAKKLAVASVHLADFMDTLALRNIPIRESTQLMLSQLNEFDQSPQIQVKVGMQINTLIRERDTWKDEFTQKGEEFISSLGGNGSHAVAVEIQRILS